MINNAKEEAKKLVAQMTLEEKISQMLHHSPAIERLNIPAYNWWSEALHGVARAGVATVFPQAIGLSAMFDSEFLKEVAAIISDEARAKHHEFVRQGDRDIYKGLTFWSPNINIFRDPRWGRGHETYGEDPYLTGELGIAFIQGLQGDDPDCMKIAACAKHFAVHSGPEALRHSFDAVVSPKDLWETYLPAFERAVKEADVESVMGAYNRTNGEPCCGSKTLLQDILRDKWGFKGHVVSDCWAICDFHLHHKVTSTPQESAAMAVRNGSDLNCGKTYPSLQVAIDEELITEEEITQACERLFTTRYKLGMFDKENRYSQIPFEIVDQPSHHEISYQAAVRSMVLLQNREELLPLKKDKTKSIAVIGPNAADAEMLLGNYNGTPSYSITPLDGIKEIMKDAGRVYYAKGCEIMTDKTEHLGMSHDRISEAVSVAQRADVAIVCVGLNARYEGEEGDAGNSRAAGDKDSLLLTGLQNELIEKIIGTGTKTIVVVFTGSAMDLRYVHQNAHGVIQAWYPGPEGGRALADLLFGEKDFSGRLPVTFVHESSDLPEFEDYSMKNRTYRYVEKAPLYSFGYGLSYNNYEYINMQISKDRIEEGQNIDITCAVKNNGTHEGIETAQVYLRDLESKWTVPQFSLVAFKSIRLKPGEEKNITLTVSADQMKVITDTGEKVFEKGGFELLLGGKGPFEKTITKTFELL
ncbi:MAG: glycoside hydrolase family 3 C-terminal domain-containing protein [Spirochaetes bacterium]|jgi:beta-glucosidase|nr:glycoside hydrolase family 3 C-terminal domain-containing protein [Spirochaetota bacterium]